MNILELTGLVSIVGIIGAIIWFIVGLVKTIIIPNIAYTYRLKHRFDKPPIAKCYCKDCKLWNPYTGACNESHNNRLMAAEWFCCFAMPASTEEITRREKEI